MRLKNKQTEKRNTSKKNFGPRRGPRDLPGQVTLFSGEHLRSRLGHKLPYTSVRSEPRSQYRKPSQPKFRKRSALTVNQNLADQYQLGLRLPVSVDATYHAGNRALTCLSHFKRRNSVLFNERAFKMCKMRYIPHE